MLSVRVTCESTLATVSRLVAVFVLWSRFGQHDSRAAILLGSRPCHDLHIWPTLR